MGLHMINAELWGHASVILYLDEFKYFVEHTGRQTVWKDTSIMCKLYTIVVWTGSASFSDAFLPLLRLCT